MIKGDIIEGIIKFNSGGNAYLVIDELTKDVQINKGHTAKALHLDKVKVKVTAITPKTQGEVVEIIERYKDEFVGTLAISSKHAFFVADDDKVKVDFFIPLNKLNGANTGQKVVVKLSDWKEGKKNPNGKVIRIIGEAGEHETEIHSIMETYGLPYKFSKNVLDEADAIPSEIPKEEFEKRLDLRQITTIGIDPINSRDADDTIGMEWDNGEAIVYVNIADISFYVTPNSEIDKEAYNRGNSYYLVDRVVHMIPERLSSDICSLKSGSDKLTYSGIFRINNQGNIVDSKFTRTIINVDKDYTYEDAQHIIENGISVENSKTDQVVLDLDRLAKSLRKNRLKDEFLQIDSPEVNFVLDENNKPIEITFKHSKDSNKLIEEFMLLTNKEVCKFIKSKGLLSINRIHETPDIGKLMNLKEFVKQFGYDLQLGENNEIRNSLNKLIAESKNTPEGEIISKLITRAQQKARYSSKNLQHYGLNFKDYSHFTSGIRRYSDIICHRILTKALGNNGYPIK